MRKIFLVEDDYGIRETLEILLTDEGYNVQSFASVAEFQNRQKTVIPDLYLFDVMLPDGSGIDLCRQIKTDKENVHIPVIMMSAHANLQDLNFECTPDDFVPKPFDIENLLLRVKEAIIK
ncbi:response regulator transcription factor [Epilithonimonas sp. JDS]|uniref:response regulator transcription factor n=1 Tax=Epilithonimonas sp. JDS TaxID=2902797 RepID=UPI001E4D12D6|nr:response regulator transcription factor [Epilithonimonas sp. JDS]MCD9856779.1 response regulator transcription factor [Epilithonimonas sp. JDS]